MSEQEVLIPAILSVDGQNIAPKTFSDIVYNSDGTTLNDSIDKILNMDYIPKLMQNTTMVDLSEGQVVVDIPFPYEGFDLENSAIIVFDSDNKLIQPKDYVITNNQLLITNTEPYDLSSHITFRFAYIKVIRLGSNNNIIDKKTIVLESTEPTVDIGIPLTDNESLCIYKNGVYIERDIDYTREGTSITLINDNEFDEDTVLTIILYKL